MCFGRAEAATGEKTYGVDAIKVDEGCTCIKNNNKTPGNNHSFLINIVFSHNYVFSVTIANVSSNCYDCWVSCALSVHLYFDFAFLVYTQTQDQTLIATLARLLAYIFLLACGSNA